MSLSDNLRRIATEADDYNRRLQEEISKLDEANFAEENRQLKEALEDSISSGDKLRKENSKLYEENIRLKNALYDKLFDEKMRILETVNSKIDSYYAGSSEKELNRLKDFEYKSRERINSIVREMRRYNISLESDLMREITQLEDKLKSKIAETKKEYIRAGGAFAENKKEQFDKLHGEAVTTDETARVLKKRNMESLIGLNIFNKIGFFFLLIGLITGVNFLYNYINDVMKSILLFGIGAVLIGAGELLHRKKPNIFSQGTTGAGIAAWIIALALSYFWLELFNAYSAMLLSIVITGVAIALSLRYDSETVASFAVVGGYLPFFYIINGAEVIYPVLIYFLLFNVIALLLSFRKKWIVMGYISYWLNVIGCIFLLAMSGNSYYSAVIPEVTPSAFTVLIYLVLVFICYSLIPVVYNLKNKKPFEKTDIIMLGVNTVISAIMLYLQFNFASLSALTGIFSLFMAGAYILIGLLTRKFLPLEKKVSELFLITSAAFIILFIPFQLQSVWFSLGWLIEAVLLMVVGVFRKYKSFINTGFIIFCLSAAAFICFNLVANFVEPDNLFFFKYLSVTLGSIVVIAAYIIAKRPLEDFMKAFTYTAAVNLWIFIIYLSVGKIAEAIVTPNFSEVFLTNSLGVTLGLIIAFFLPRIKHIRDDIIKGISFFIYSASLLWLFILNIVVSPVNQGSAPASFIALGTVVLIILNGLAVFAMHDLVKALVLERKLGAEWYPLCVSAFFVILLTENLIAHYNLAFNNFVISIIYIVTAFAWIILGFVRRYSFIRRFGLGLSFLAIAKLFIVDLYYITEGYRIITYFVFGIILIAISFVYQYFSKNLEIKAETAEGIKPSIPEHSENNLEIENLGNEKPSVIEKDLILKEETETPAIEEKSDEPALVTDVNKESIPLIKKDNITDATASQNLKPAKAEKRKSETSGTDMLFDYHTFEKSKNKDNADSTEQKDHNK
jgi:uncharacterized membrane protein